MDSYQIERLRVIADVLGKATEQADKAAVEHVKSVQPDVRWPRSHDSYYPTALGYMEGIVNVIKIELDVMLKNVGR
jgi:hypothetical protein